MDSLIALTAAFLTATGLFFAALGATATYNEPLKVFLSISALVMSVVWLCVGILLPEANVVAETDVSLSDEQRENAESIEYLLGVLLPSLFIAGWTVSLAVHGYRWFKEVPRDINTHQ